MKNNSTKRRTKEEFCEKAKKIHGDKYNYSKVEYVNNLTPVCITCPKHGDFFQQPKSHLMGHGCKKCGDEKCRDVNLGVKRKNKKHVPYNTEIFKEEAVKIHGNKYDYSKVEYVNSIKKVCIVCPEHGEFWQRPVEHLKQKSGCPLCANKKRHDVFSNNTEKFVLKANKLFFGKYSYEKSVYYNNSTKVIITCPKHGDFLCTPQNHLKGRGCPICKSESYVYEERLYSFLRTIFDEKEIVRQYRENWLTNNKSLDFFIPRYNIAIEHQGEQHVKPVKIFGGEKNFNRVQELDVEKHAECIKNGVNIIYFSYQSNIDFSSFIEKVYTNENEFMKKINEIINNKKDE